MTDTIATALAAARVRLPADEQDDAQWLLAALLGKSRSYLYSWPDTPLASADRQAFFDMVHRRASGEPLAYITGEQPFWTLQLAVSPAVLIPRPETELLVEAILQAHPPAPLTVVDAGTGSGAIALALASERPHWQLVATDRSAAALQVAAANSRRYDLPVRFVQANWLAAVADNSLDVLVSNPPYIAAGDSHLPALRHEPLSALVAGADGLDDIAVICRQAARVLKPGGRLYIEHGYDQGQAVAACFATNGLVDVVCQRDLAGHQRFTSGARP
ncbi:MAG TPA: peptide chain release factor N(5)-glutamine methyltransferase [Pseudomonadales bacterium]